MKKNLKSLFIGIVVSLFITSCSALTAKEQYERGDYIGALETTAQELKNAKKAIPIEIENEIISRIRETENRYLSIIKNATDDRTKANAYFELWQMGNIIEKNPILERYTDFRSRQDNYRNLSMAIESIKKYTNLDLNNRVNALDEFIVKLGKAEARNSQYSSLYESFARYTADVYINRAESLERLGNLAAARDMYYKGYESYKDFSDNYRNSQQKYVNLKRDIDIAEAVKLYESGINLYNLGRFEEAKSRLEQSRNIYSRYSMNRNVEQIDVYLRDIVRRVDLDKANRYFDEGKTYYNSGNYERAKIRFIDAKEIYEKYRNYTLSREIDVYLENIKYRVELQSADKYFEEGQRNYNLQRYDVAKDAFEKAREIYISRGERAKVSQIDVYLENIRTRTGNNSANNFNVYYRQASSYVDQGNRSNKIEDANYFYNLAIDSFKKALNYTNDYYQRNEVNKYIKELETKIKNNNITKENKYKFIQEYNKAVELIKLAEKQPNIDDANYYYRQAITAFKNALNYTNDRNKRNELNTYISNLEKRISENTKEMKNEMRFDELYNKAKEQIRLGESKINKYDSDYYYQQAINTLREALKYTKNTNKISDTNRVIADLESRIRKDMFNNDFNFYYLEAKEFVRVGDTKIRVEDSNYYYLKAIESFEKAIKLTTDQKKINEINLNIRDLKSRIVF
ncbi:hypothetical protein [Streptobacillus canis]|uniref:hypothetical protein n=1 Tax=Streptobacillus canis TaxID=2678686 RepID=UPI0012E304C7|nr:hypothetical protein [Streptobacillus canis]